MGVGYEPDRDTRRDDQQALEEIRRLFARYREAARHGVAIEHDEPAELRAEESEETQAVALQTLRSAELQYSVGSSTAQPRGR